MPKLIHLLHIINPENNKEIDNAIQILSLKINIKTDKEILFGNEEHLISKTGIDKKHFEIIKKRLINYYSSNIINGEDLFSEYLSNKDDSIKKYSFGYKKIDQLINGGVTPGDIIELVGSISTGKTQLSLLLSLNVLLLNNNNTVLYLDTRGSFSIKRIIDFYYADDNISEKKSENIKNLISRIKHQGVYSYNELFNILEAVMKDIENLEIESSDNNFNKNLKLVVINSISSLIFPIISQNDIIRNSILCSITQYLNIMAKKHKITILLTNFTVGINFNNFNLYQNNNLEYYNKKKEFYNHQKLCNINIKNIIHQYYEQNLNNEFLPKDKIEEISQIINNLKNDFPQCLEINRSISNSIIRDNKKPSLSNVWTYTPDIQLFICNLESSQANKHLENNNNYNNDNDNDNDNDKLPNNKRQKLDKNNININKNKTLKKIEVVLSHKTTTGQSCYYYIDKNGLIIK
ncbi:P-loop containing nucleoside triphosphate hydrolase protein [Anaeromyces robustus]|uniref:p-loop containing nucleoside triphosphate hydrolase protein n=1 Tax=Anaeromyces robustus TaxID=1754192 RepID=A0A1Y1XN07_9FUNG|nr:P-loop containing nucleoside triphosphate hydrolase protein [Anaeromyces robustus]|eukprot:ORX87055.1 P-loop containing nucleoside triphosphate hydrolase protein [Anaeromyces robustus]